MREFNDPALPYDFKTLLILLQEEAERQRVEIQGEPCRPAKSHYFRRDSDGVWVCQNEGCNERRGAGGRTKA